MRRLAVLLIAILLAWPGDATRAADCPDLPPPYTGPIFDAQVQAWNPRVDGLIGAAQNAGVKHIAFFANSKAGSQSPTAMAVQALAQAHPELLVLGAPKIGFIHGGDLPRGYVSDTVAGVRSGTSNSSAKSSTRTATSRIIRPRAPGISTSIRRPAARSSFSHNSARSTCRS